MIREIRFYRDHFLTFRREVVLPPDQEELLFHMELLVQLKRIPRGLISDVSFPEFRPLRRFMVSIEDRHYCVMCHEDKQGFIFFNGFKVREGEPTYAKEKLAFQLWELYRMEA
ncbi:MAG: hypothetical protein AAFR61_08285 [Bacteroidota bacterium]